MNPSPTPTMQELLDGYYRSIKKAFYWILFFSFFINALMLALPLYMLQIYTRVLPSQSMDTLIYLTLIVIIILAIFALLSSVRTYMLIELSTWLDHELSALAFKKMPDQVLENNEYAQHAFLDVLTIRQFLTSGGVTALLDFPWSSIYIAVIFLLYSWLGVFSLVAGALLFAFAVLNEISTKTQVIKSTTQFKKNQVFIQSISKNSDTLQAMGLTENLQNLWLKNNHEALTLHKETSKKSEIYLSIIKFLRVTAQVFILGLGAYFVLQNEITTGAMLAASILMSRALAPIEQAVSSWKLFIQFRDAMQRLRYYLKMPESRLKTMRLPDPIGKIFLENVYYSYPSVAQYALQQMTLIIQPGDLVAVAGPSASGKTTLCRIILGILNPKIGKAKLDGGDIYHRDRTEIGKWLGYLPQDIELFSGTIKDNIARMGEVDSSEVVEAAKIAGAHEMILNLPQSYDTKIEGTKGLSAGQMQRIGLARALYKNPKVVVLDEPYSNLDTEGEEALLKAIIELKRRKTTTIIISHRIDLIRNVDKIIYLLGGKLKYYGPRDDVLNALQKELSAKNQPIKGLPDEPGKQSDSPKQP